MLLWFTVLVTCWSLAVSLTYNSTKAILTDRYGAGRYHKEVVPMLDQSKAIQVNVSFELVSLVEVDDVAQRFTCNGFLMFQWVDEMAAWDPSDYGNQTMVHPLPETIWRPRVILMNTMGDRDLFQDDKAPVFVQSDGSTLWAPGSLFPASCQLKMENYPFDQHSCVIQLVAMTLSTRELEFVATTDSVGEMFFILNGEWDLKSSKVEISRFNSGPVNLSSVVFLSFLNLLVFVIPVES